MKLLLALVSATLVCGIAVCGQDRNPDRKEEAPKAQDPHRLLGSSLDTKDFLVPMTFKEFLGLLHDKLKAKKELLPVVVDAKAFQDKNINVYNAPLRPIASAAVPMPVGLILQAVVNQLPGDAAWTVRDGKVLIAPKGAPQKK